MVQLELTKQFPISPRVLFFSVVGLSALVCSVVILFVLGCGLISMAEAKPTNPILQIFAIAVVVVPSLSLTLAIMENLLIMWLPAWFMVRPEDAKKGGVEFMGRAMIGLLGRFLVMSLLLLIPCIAGGALFLLGSFMGESVIVFSAWLTSILLVIEMVLLGGNAAVMFNKLDPSSVEYQ